MKKIIFLLIFTSNYLFAGMWLMNSDYTENYENYKKASYEKTMKKTEYSNLSSTEKFKLFALPVGFIFIVLLIRNRKKTRF